MGRVCRGLGPIHRIFIFSGAPLVWIPARSIDWTWLLDPDTTQYPTPEIMRCTLRTTIPRLLLVLPLALVGCGHVAGNYPDPEASTPKALPEHYQHGNLKTELIWKEPGELHGFLVLWEHSELSTARLHGFASKGYANAAEDEARFQPMADADYACAAVWVFVSPGFHRGIWPENMRIEFTDGSSASSKELFLYAPVGSTDPVQSSVDGTITLDAKADPDRSGRYLYIFLPAEHLEKEVVRISRVSS